MRIFTFLRDKTARGGAELLEVMRTIEPLSKDVESFVLSVTMLRSVTIY